MYSKKQYITKLLQQKSEHLFQKLCRCYLGRLTAWEEKNYVESIIHYQCRSSFRRR